MTYGTVVGGAFDSGGSRQQCWFLHLHEKTDFEDKENFYAALKDGQSWPDSNLEGDAVEIKDVYMEVKVVCASIVSKYFA